MSCRRRVALVTGASSGLGKGLARRFSEQGWEVISVSRSQSPYGRWISCDLTQKDQRVALIETLKEVPIDLVIQSAGFGLYGGASQLLTEEQLSLLELNMMAVAHLSIEWTKVWRKTGQKGTILNLSSVAAYYVFPFFAAYAASKSFVLQFSRALDAEVKPYGIRVLVSCPGQVATPFANHASHGHFTQTAGGLVMDADWAVSRIEEQIVKHIAVDIFDWRYRWLVYVSYLLPVSVYAALFSKTLGKRSMSVSQETEEPPV